MKRHNKLHDFLNGSVYVLGGATIGYLIFNSNNIVNNIFYFITPVVTYLGYSTIIETSLSRNNKKKNNSVKLAKNDNNSDLVKELLKNKKVDIPMYVTDDMINKENYVNLDSVKTKKRVRKRM